MNERPNLASMTPEERRMYRRRKYAEAMADPERRPGMVARKKANAKKANAKKAKELLDATCCRCGGRVGRRDLSVKRDGARVWLCAACAWKAVGR